MSDCVSITSLKGAGRSRRKKQEEEERECRSFNKRGRIKQVVFSFQSSVKKGRSDEVEKQKGS